MLRCRLQTAVFLLAAIAIPILPLPSCAQTFVASAQSWDALKSDSLYLLDLFGMGKSAKEQIDEFVRSAIGAKEIAWLDSGKPLGVYGDFPAQLGMPIWVFFVPIADEKGFLDFLPTLATHKFEKGSDGIYVVQADPAQKYYLRFAKKYAYISSDVAAIRRPLHDPENMKLSTRPGRPMAASFRIDRLPEGYKGLVVAGLAVLKLSAKPAPGQTEGQFKDLQTILGLALDDLTRLPNESREITMHVEVNRELNTLALEVGLVPEKNTRLARQVQNLGSSGTLFGNLSDDAVASLGLRVSFPDKWRDALSSLAVGYFESELSKKLNLKDKALLRRALNVFEPTLKAGTVDFGIALQGPKPDGIHVLVAGLKIEEGKKVEQLFRDFLRDQQADFKSRFTCDFAKHGTTRIHKIGDDRKVGDPTDDLTRLLAVDQGCVSIRDDVILVTVGKHCVQGMKDTLDIVDRGAVPEAMRLECSLIKLFTAMMDSYETKENRQRMEVVRKILVAADKKRDRASLRLYGGETLRLRLQLDSQIVRTAGAVYPAFLKFQEKPLSK